MKRYTREILSAFERLSGREQIMVLVLAVAVSTAFLGFGSFLIRRDLRRTEARIEAKLGKIQEIVALRGDYQKRLSDQQQMADAIRKNGELRLLSYLEDLSKRTKIELGQASDRPGRKSGSSPVVESSAEVLIKNVSMDRLYNFLTAIEEGNQLVKVRQLRIRTRFDDPKKLDANVTVGTFHLAEET
jgi:general secretion pathway protein M